MAHGFTPKLVLLLSILHQYQSQERLLRDFGILDATRDLESEKVWVSNFECDKQRIQPDALR